MIIIIIVGVTIIVAICIVTIIIRCRCMNRAQSAQEYHQRFETNSIPPNYGHASSKAHQGSSWACTFKGGQQINTHIWETPLPEPQEGEYTLPASMKKQLYPNNTGSIQETKTLPSNVSHSQMPHDSDYTLPSNMRQTSQQGGQASAQPQYTMPVKMKQQQNPMTTSTALTTQYLFFHKQCLTHQTLSQSTQCRSAWITLASGTRILRKCQALGKFFK